MKYSVFKTECYPKAFKVGTSLHDSNDPSNYFATFAEAQAEANERNKWKSLDDASPAWDGRRVEIISTQGFKFIVNEGDTLPRPCEVFKWRYVD